MIARQILKSKNGFISTLPLLGAIFLFLVLSVIALILGYFLKHDDSIKSGVVESIGNSAMLNDLLRLSPDGKQVSKALNIRDFPISDDGTNLSKTIYYVLNLDKSSGAALQRFYLEDMYITSTKQVPVNGYVTRGFLPNTVVVLHTYKPVSNWEAIGKAAQVSNS